jgi:eukaryotic-like serine/threonine-protein kinase
MSAGFSTGQHIGDYEIISILGAGGMGKVYKVRNVISERIEAMKILLPDLTSNQSLADRFLREIRLLATLHHPNIAALRTALTYENQLVMIIEYVEGETLANRVARAPMSTAEVVNYSDQCLGALSYAHKQNIIHRDIKPANMMITPDGVVKLMDFGIARSNKDGSLTSTGTTLGSLNYMPPEQVRGEGADARSDIYSFGASLYEMLTGKLPFDTDSQYALMTAQLNSDPPPPITIRGDLPPALNQIILMCMAKDPDKRFQSADALRAALKTIPVSAMPPARTTAVPGSAPSPTPSPAAKSPAPAAAAFSSETTLIDHPLTPRPGAVPTPAPTQAQPLTPAPQPPQAAPAALSAGPLPPPESRPSATHRGLWVALGSLVGVSVLLAAGIYIPRHMGTHADPATSSDSPSSPSQPPTTSGDSSAPSTPSSPAAGSTPSANSDSGPVNIQVPGVGVSVDDKGNVAIKTPGGTVSATADGDAHISAPGASVSATKDGSASVTAGGAAVRVAGRNASAATRAASRAAAQAQQPPSAPAAVPSPNSGPSADEIQRLTDDGEKLNVRADTVNEGLNTLKQQQAASGLGLRADMVSAQQRMGLFLKKGNDALQHGDTANAQKYFDQADGEISKLEKFLGH